MKVFVLAGGYGVRFQPYTDIIPKCLLPVAGKPCVRYIIDSLVEQSFCNITLCINKKDEKLFQHEFRGEDIKFSISEQPLGTAGEIFHNWGNNTKRKDGFMLVYGDDLTFRDYRKLYQFHLEQKKYRKGQRVIDASIVVTTRVELPFGSVGYEHNTMLIFSFNEKPVASIPMWVGVGIFEPIVGKYLQYHRDFGRDVIPAMIKDGYSILGYLTEDPWISVGNLEQWRLANKLMEK